MFLPRRTGLAGDSGEGAGTVTFEQGTCSLHQHGVINLSEKLVSQAGPGPVVPIVGQGASRNLASVTVTRLQAVRHPLLLLLAFLINSPSSQVPCTARQHAGLGFRGCGATSQTKGSRVALYFMPLSFFVRTGRRGCRKRKRQKYNSREKAGELSSEWRSQVKGS